MSSNVQNQRNVGLNLTLGEINTILTALGERPYVQVYELVRKIQAQIGGQQESAAANDLPISGV